MIDTVTLKFGSSPNQEALRFAPGPLTVFVGPNNAGKSLGLRELHQTIVDSSQLGAPYIIESVTYRTDQNVKDTFERCILSIRDVFQNQRQYGFRFPGSPGVNIDVASLENFIKNGEWSRIFRALRPLLTCSLTGRNRFDLLRQQALGDLQRPTNSHLARLVRDRRTREHLQNLTYEAFGYYPIVDISSSVGQGLLKMSPRKPESQEEETFVHEHAVEFQRRAIPISQFSDGVQAYVGILSFILATEHLAMFVDEPDAFLAPPLSHRLGNLLSTIAAERRATIFSATHDANFLLGALAGGRSLNVIRLTYSQGVASARLLAADELERMMRDPLLRSSNVLAGLFHEGCVVCEADADRAFYDEIFHRLSTYGRTVYPGPLAFLNAHGRQECPRIVEPLRRMGIPAACIIDLDLILDEAIFKRVCRAASIPAEVQSGYGQTRSALAQAVEERSAVKQKGLEAFEGTKNEAAHTLVRNLEDYGVFLVSVGELERWLPQLGISPGRKDAWLSKMFEHMGSDPAHADYVGPTEGDVWAFMSRVAHWISDPNRSGIPT